MANQDQTKGQSELTEAQINELDTEFNKVVSIKSSIGEVLKDYFVAGVKSEIAKKIHGNHVEERPKETWSDVCARFKHETRSSVFATNAFSHWLSENYAPPQRISQAQD